MADLLRLKNNQPLFLSPDVNTPDLTRLSLRKISRAPGNNWKLLESGIPAHALPEWFERHIWLDGAGDRPKDFRARRFAGELAGEVDQITRLHLVKNCSPIYRATFNCAQACCRDFEAEDEEEFDERHRDDDTIESDKGSDSSESSIDESEEEQLKSKRTRVTNSTRECDVVLHVEITADRPGEAKIWQHHNHPDADSRALTWSLRLRRVATEDLSTLGGTASKVQKSQYISLLSKREASYAWNVPEYRRPTTKQVENIFPAFRRQERLAKNSFEALSKFAQMNADRVYHYLPHAPNADVPSKLTCASSDDWSKDSAILHSCRNGVGFDSAHRHKNENFAPVTLLTTVDSNGRMVPSSATVEDRSPEEVKEIKRWAACIVTHGWNPSHFMIDKSTAEKHAIEQVWGHEVLIRVCQFHIVQAIQRWVDERSKKGSKTNKTKPRLSVSAMKDVLVAFRYLQRCRDTSKDPWNTALSIFEGELRRICTYHGFDNALPVVRDYFRKNWWSEEWRDIGLPLGQTRDGTFNTNNWTEAAFKTFDLIFLESRKNKRQDDGIKPWSAIPLTQEPRPSRQFVAVTRQGHDFWSADNVIPVKKSLNRFKIYYTTEWNTAAASDTTAALAARSSFGGGTRESNIKRPRDNIFSTRVDELLGHLDPENYSTDIYGFGEDTQGEGEASGAAPTPVSPTKEIPRPSKSRKREKPASSSSTSFQSPSGSPTSSLPVTYADIT
ncbi:hypothetical protein HWV62_41176 [Athelia sp. TMB]|nr:hypothetical protein HWV62_41176 [Athelia sp. TMB]